MTIIKPVLDPYKNKKDEGKLRLDLVPPEAIEAIGETMEFGLKKGYELESWRKVEVERYRAAMMRHICNYLKNPQGKDEESNLSHTKHVLTNAAFLVALEAK